MTAKEFIYSLPGQVNPDAIEGHESTFHFNLSGEGGGEFTVHVLDGKVDVADGFNGDPKCIVTAKADDMMGVVNKTLNPIMAITMGKLKISNLGEMMRYAQVFGFLK
ncbi:MAG: SCP2 sterol-binding domain-containing protein [Saprospiraceae bacterium]|nr:SCP2 sterol-binding domain-containing protein [Saprospiraceae bacterium]